MEKEFLKLGFNSKQYKVYMYLVEYGASAASEISRHISIPKSTVNFLADTLWKKGIIKKFYRGKTGYYEVDIEKLEEIVQHDADERIQILQALIPILKEKNKGVISRPKISFIDGVDACKEAYLSILKSKKIFYEFGAHKDLSQAFGEAFMDDFIEYRVNNNIFCDSIGNNSPTEQKLKGQDIEQLRSLLIFPKSFGEIHSSIAIYDQKVLILNLKGICNGVLIENKEFSETMMTIFKICKSSGEKY